MAKLKNPLLSLKASGTIARVLTFARRGKVDLVEKKPEIKDVQSEPQLAWRHMFNKCVDLWHELSAAEKAVWESQGTARHMTGYAWYLSQCLRPNPGIYLPLQGGTMSGDIDMAKNRLLQLPAPIDGQEPARKAEIDALVRGYTAGARVYHSSTQSIPNTTVTVLSFDSERWDTDTIHDPVTNNSRLTCKTAGKYLIIGQARFFSNATGYRVLYIRLNNTTYIAISGVNAVVGSATGLIHSTIYDLAVGDYVNLQVYQNSGAARGIYSTAQFTPEFMMQRIG